MNEAIFDEEESSINGLDEDIKDISINQLKNTVFYAFPREKPIDHSSFCSLKGWIPDPQKIIIGKNKNSFFKESLYSG